MTNTTNMTQNTNTTTGKETTQDTNTSSPKDIPFFNVVYRSENEELPPSAITNPDCPVWFSTPKYFFGQRLMDTPKGNHARLDGWVIGMQWDEHDWTYTIMDSKMGMIWDSKEDELLLFTA